MLPNGVRVITYGPRSEDVTRYYYQLNGKACDMDSVELKVDGNGHINFTDVPRVRVIPASRDDRDDLAYTIGPDGRPRAMDDTLLRTDVLGHAIWPVPEAAALRDIQAIVLGDNHIIRYFYDDENNPHDMDGNLLLFDQRGHIMFPQYPHLRIIPGKDHGGTMLPTDKDGNLLVFPAGSHFINMGQDCDDTIYMIGEDGLARDLSGNLLPTDEEGHIITAVSKQIQITCFVLNVFYSYSKGLGRTIVSFKPSPTITSFVILGKMYAIRDKHNFTHPSLTLS